MNMRTAIVAQQLARLELLCIGLQNEIRDVGRITPDETEMLISWANEIHNLTVSKEIA